MTRVNLSVIAADSASPDTDTGTEPQDISHIMAALRAEIGYRERRPAPPRRPPSTRTSLVVPFPQVDTAHRFSSLNPCPICGGHPGFANGMGLSCKGFLSADGRYAYCTREQYAGQLALNEHTEPESYRHRLNGPCKCGERHGTPADPKQAETGDSHKVRERMWELWRPDGTLAGIHKRIDYSDGSKRMYWEQHNGASSQDMPLYNVRNLLQAQQGVRVYVTEGEKACDALVQQGILAVGTVNGAPKIPCDESLQPLLGYDVVLWPDNDEVGRKHMDGIAARLYALGAQQVLRVDWPSAPAKGDAANYIEAGKPLDFLPELLRAYSQPDNGTGMFELLTMEDVAKLPEQTPILGKVLIEGSTSFIYGPSGVWKTFVALSFGLSIAYGQEWLGLPVKQGMVVYITGEGVGGIAKRIQAWQRYHGRPNTSNFRMVRQIVHFMDEREVDRLIRSIDAQLVGEQPTLIIVDTLVLAMAGGNENDAGDASTLLTAANRLRDTYNACVLFIHHTGHDTSRMRGSTALFGNADTVIRVESPETGGKLKPGMAARLVSDKPRDFGPFPTVTFTTELLAWPSALPPHENIGSLVIVESNEPIRPHTERPEDTSPPKSKYSEAAILSWKALVKASADSHHEEGLTWTEWQKLMERSGKVTRSTFERGKTKLLEGGWVRQNGNLFCATTPNDRIPTTGAIHFADSNEEEEATDQ